MTRSSRTTRYPLGISPQARALGVTLGIAFAGLTWAHTAQADTVASASDLESARSALLQGRALRGKGDLAGALEKFKAAHALAHTPVTGIELAKTHAALGQPVEARDICFAVGRMPITREETSRSREARDEANTLAEAMKDKVATLTVTLKTPGQQAALVKVDGVEVPAVALTEGRKVNPGKHVVSARIGDGPEATVTATLREGETKAVELAPEAPKVGKGPDPLPPPPPPEVERKTLSPLVPIGFGVGAAGLLVGSIAGVLALGKKGDLNCQANPGSPSLCYDSPSGSSAATTLSSARSVALVSTVGFVVAGVGAAVGVVGLLTPGTVRVGKQGRISPYFDGLGTGLHGTF